MAIITFDPPGNLDEMNAASRAAWHQYISRIFDQARLGDPNDPFNPERRQFFNPAKVDVGADAMVAQVEWIAFPRLVEINAPSKLIAWQRADADRLSQDEYCEWSVIRDTNSGKLVRAAFTCEDADYWKIFAENDPNRALDLYREHVNEGVQLNDIFDSQGGYQPVNRWNHDSVDGAMHMIQGNNTIGAAIALAAGASIVRANSSGTLLTDTQALIKCGSYGAAERNSDPFIGAGVNGWARRKADVTLANPVDLAFAALDMQDFETPDGSAPEEWRTFTRGSANTRQRLVLEAPAGGGFVLGDAKINDRPLHYGGQIAEKITMRIRALATRIGQSTVEPVRGCVGGGSLGGIVAAGMEAVRPLRGRI